MSDVIKSEENIYDSYGKSPGKNGTWREWIEYAIFLFKNGGSESKAELGAEWIKALAAIGGYEPDQYTVTRFFGSSIVKMPVSMMMKNGDPTNILPTNQSRWVDLYDAFNKFKDNYTIEDLVKVKANTGKLFSIEPTCTLKPRYASGIHPFSCEILLRYQYKIENGNKTVNMDVRMKFIVAMTDDKSFQFRLFYFANSSGGGYDVCCIPKFRFNLSIRAGSQVTNSTEVLGLQDDSNGGKKIQTWWSEGDSQINYQVDFEAYHFDQNVGSDAVTGKNAQAGEDGFNEILNIKSTWRTGYGPAKNGDPFYFDFCSGVNNYMKKVDYD